MYGVVTTGTGSVDCVLTRSVVLDTEVYDAETSVEFLENAIVVKNVSPSVVTLFDV